MSAKPVMYLDVDGVLWDIHPDAKPGDAKVAKGANGVAEFMDFAHEHFEVRWCTTWAMSGRMHPETRDRLVEHTGVPFHIWSRVRSSLGFQREKHDNIDAEMHRETGRPFVWVEDELTEEDHQWLRGNHWADRYFLTNVFTDPDSLKKTHAKLETWLDAICAAVSCSPTVEGDEP